MTKRALSAVAGFLGLCLSLSAQPARGLEGLQFDGITPPYLTLTDRDLFTFSTAFGWAPPTSAYLPAFNPWDPRNVEYPYSPRRSKSLDNGVEMRSPDRIYFGGEVGFLYGRSTGKYGREDFQTYITGTVGNEHFSITAGYLRQESSLNVPRRRR
ncbi:MAG TPA: hypothetical protein VNP98_15660 [Chthoniobacterales bacterium]|nr:hypothetical protein [Chthoniobacterales bacterium]